MKKSEQATESSYWAQYRYFLLAFVAAVAVFGVSAWLAHYKVLTGWEYTWLKWVNDWPERLRTVFVVLVLLGSVWAAAVVVMSAFVLRIYQLAWRLSLSVLTVYGLTVLAKFFIEHPQPALLAGDIQSRMVEVGTAFPSTHVAVATVLGLVVFTYLPRIWQWPSVIFWIAAVSLARLYLGVTAPLGVIGGFALGVGVVCFWRILPQLIKKFLRLREDS